MAKVSLNPIGAQITAVNVENRAELEALESKLASERARIRDGWGQKYAERVAQKGKFTTWERIDALIDPGSKFLTVGTFINDGVEFEQEGIKRTSPAAGVIVGFGLVKDRWAVVIANDNTVASGSWWPNTPEKIIRGQEIALKLRLPVIYLVDCSGLFLPEQGKSFPGQYGAGKIFKMNSRLSDAGVPQIAGVMGDCIAGGGYMPIISDKVIMTEKAYMVIAGTAVIRGAKSQNLTSQGIGGPNVHVHESNCADLRAPDDATCLDMIRAEFSKLASSANSYYRHEADAASPNLDPVSLRDVLPADSTQIYPIREVVARLADDSLFWEFFKDFGQEVVMGIARISGLFVGIVANNQEPYSDPNNRSTKRPGGSLCRNGVAKMSQFVRACNDDGIPLVWLQDVSGFDVGIEPERQGLLGYGSSLIYANSTHEVPMATILLRKASGAGYYAMAGMPYDPVLQLGTVMTRLGVMEGKTLAVGAYHSRLDDNFQITSRDPAEIKLVKEGMKGIEARIDADMNPYLAARRGDIDELVRLDEIREYLIFFAEAAYQNQGSRRIKNPRIWSLHDLQLCSGTVLSPGDPSVYEEEVEKPRSSETKKRGRQSKLNSKSIVSPMDGMLFLSPKPGESPFVKVGDKLKAGDTVALLEVMKSYYPIKFEGTSAAISKIVVADGVAICAGETIFSIK